MRPLTPEAGRVISYSYLWYREYLAGRIEGVKDRPAAIVLTSIRGPDEITVVTVVPITHSPPIEPGSALPIPEAIRRHLGLDEAPSWVVVSEFNRFIWPGYDLRPRQKSGRYDYGFLPPHFFDQLRLAFLEWRRSGRQRLTPRD